MQTDWKSQLTSSKDSCEEIHSHPMAYVFFGTFRVYVILFSVSPLLQWEEKAICFFQQESSNLKIVFWGISSENVHQWMNFSFSKEASDLPWLPSLMAEGAIRTVHLRLLRWERLLRLVGNVAPSFRRMVKWLSGYVRYSSYLRNKTL